MKNFQGKTEATSTRLLDKIRDIHPNLKFCGEPKNAILSIPDDLLSYVLSLLRDDPIHPPLVSIAQWMELIHILELHWIIPLLYCHIGKLTEEFRPPEPVLDNMRTTFQWSRARCFQIEKQLGEILTAFNDEDVRVLVLKGPALGRTVYPDPALRPSSDLDLLVLPDQVPRSRTILERLGYKCDAGLFDAEKTLYKDESFVHTENSRNYRTIELHWRLHHFLGFTQEARLEDLFLRAIKMKSHSLTFEVLDPIDAIIHTAINNAFGHDDSIRLVWVYDIVLLARNLAVPDDWELLQKRCVAWRARLAVELSLRMAQNWLGLSLPPRFQDFSTWPQPTEIEVDGWEKVVQRCRGLSTLIKLRMPPCSGSLERIRFLYRLFFPPLDKVRKDFPPSNDILAPLAYVRRWRQWAKKLRS